MRPVIIKITGGLGNQLFQYAAGYAVAKKLKTSLRVDLSSFNEKLSSNTTSRNFLLDRFNISTIANNGHDLSESLQQNNSTNIYTESSFFYSEDLKKVKAPVILKGYFQSERYFSNVEPDIRSQFTLRDSLSMRAQQYSKTIIETPIPVSLHIRRGDMAHVPYINKFHGVMTIDYYKRAIYIMQKMYGTGIHFFVFSDEPDYVRKHFDFVTNKTIIIGDTEYPQEDLCLMSQCHHHIIANSTFSWWGAWLSPHPGKTIIAPRWWFTRETMKVKNTIDLYPEGWLVI